MFNGEVKINVQGVERTLKFGTLSSARFCELEKIHMKDMKTRLDNPEPMTQIHWVYAAALAHCEIKNLPMVTLGEVSEWIDEVGEERLAEMVIVAMKVYLEKTKNHSAPQMVGQ